MVDDDWDDLGYETLFRLVYFDEAGVRWELGQTKIMQLGMSLGRVVVELEFSKLSRNYASLGTDQKFYENVAALGAEIAREIFASLRDAAWTPSIFRMFREDPAFTQSLMRGLKISDVHKFEDIAYRRATLTPFEFQYDFVIPRGPGLLFSVTPHTLPPTNIHTIIGRNGVGKTRLIRSLISLLCDGGAPNSSDGRLTFTYKGNEGDGEPARLICVAFSAFDDISLPISTKGTQTGIHLSYIGLRRPEGDSSSKAESKSQLKSLAELTAEFVTSLQMCLRSSRKQLWIDTIAILESDPIFGSMGLRDLADSDETSSGGRAGELFRRASSGHKIVLLSVTRLVELVEERTLVLIDEPEAHLHPPLQGSYIRALSALLTAKNGLAILATHSPVMLQEVPRECVWLLFRDGESTSNERPQIETFAENLGVLTREVFRVEVTQSGYHTMLQREVENVESIDQLLARFNDQLGAEGRAIARSLWRHRSARGDEA